MEDDLSDGGELLDTEMEQRVRDASRIRRISIPLLKVSQSINQLRSSAGTALLYLLRFAFCVLLRFFYCTM
jgi:hypothetical protein